MNTFNKFSPSNDGAYKFLNCTNRSKTIIEKTIQRCQCQGGNYIDKGYQCFKKNLFKISPDICQYCLEFELKESKQ